MKHLGNNATEANRQRNKCRGQPAKKHLGNNAAEANQQRNISATMQRRQISKETSATMQRRQIGEETSIRESVKENQSKLCFLPRFALSLLQQNQQKQYKSHTIMSTIIYDKVVFGPINSRRLGISLGGIYFRQTASVVPSTVSIASAA